MERNHMIIIALVVVIAALAVGVAFLMTAKEECKLTIKCNETLKNGDKITIKLTGKDDNPIANAKLKVKLSGSDDKNYELSTDSKGKATMKLSDIDAGNYSLNATFEGDDHHTPASCQKKFKVKEEVVEAESQQSDIDANRPVNDENYKGYNPYHESEVTSDGWNPREHEVSRQSMGDGNEKIKYDDGYFRIVDSNGYVITYGYGG